ncbi:3-keto-disaccharide hydrolase [Luteolibacter soli]|uniref:DUF1080 domain-containing protein n=1 Tax=Luteolibacter soli TaxID=3135280 RepID=A0ABU9AYS0_9BACT
MIKKLFTALMASALVLTASAADQEKDEKGFVSLFDGKTLDGWKVGGDQKAIRVEDGAIVANGNCTHAYYMGKDGKARFKDFELRADIMTKPNSNGGFYIHVDYQDSGWPIAKGYEVQVNNTQSDVVKSGSLYHVVDNKVPFEDNTWMKYVIRVKNGKITVSVNGKELVDYKPKDEESKLQKDGGTFAIQAHDPGSTTLYKNIRVKEL